MESCGSHLSHGIKNKIFDPAKRQIFWDTSGQIFSFILRPCHTEYKIQNMNSRIRTLEYELQNICSILLHYKWNFNIFISENFDNLDISHLSPPMPCELECQHFRPKCFEWHWQDFKTYNIPISYHFIISVAYLHYQFQGQRKLEIFKLKIQTRLSKYKGSLIASICENVDPFLSYIKRQNNPKYGNLSRIFHIYLTASGEGRGRMLECQNWQDLYHEVHQSTQGKVHKKNSKK